MQSDISSIRGDTRKFQTFPFPMTSFFAAISRFIRRLFRTQRPRVEPRGTQRDQREDFPLRPRLQGRRLDQPTLSADAIGSATNESQKLESQQPAVANALRRLVYQATWDMPTARMHAGQFGSRLRQIDPSFTYEKYQFSKLIYLLEAVPDIVSLERVNNPGAAPAYYVRSPLDARALLIEALTSFDSEDGWVHADSAIAAMKSTNSDFSIETYGFSTPQAFIASHTDLIETKSKDTSYVRLRQPHTPPPKTPKRVVQPKRPYTQPVIKSTDRPKPKVSSNQGTRAIVHLSKFAGFTPQVLNQKVSELAAIALNERWYFGPQPPADFAYPILKSYLRYTFIRLQHERKVITSTHQKYRAFNSGLLDKLLRPIYALLISYPSSPQSWELVFCIPGEGPNGKALVSNFTVLPAAANYLSDPAKIFYHLTAGAPEVDWHHVIKDNMERLPSAFLAQYAPANFTYRNTQTLSGSEFHTYKKSFATALDNDPRAYRSIVNRLEEAMTRTLLKTQINYKTAVPTYYPNINSIDLLLPICLVEEDVADCALVVRMANSGKYIGHTILTLRQAYNNARLICKLDEHWLTRSMTLSQGVFEEEDDDSEEFEAEDDDVVESDDESLPEDRALSLDGSLS